MKKQDSFPILGIQEFQAGISSNQHLLFHELSGEHLIEKAHKHDFFMMFLVKEGTGIHTIDFQEYPVQKLQLHILFPGQVHKWSLNKDIIAHQLMISRAVFENIQTVFQFTYSLYQQHPVIELGKDVFDQLWYEFVAIRQELQQENILWSIINLRSHLILQLISREVEQHFEDLQVYKSKPVLIKYHDLVDKNYKEHKSVSFYAEQLHITANYLNILCKRHLNVPATHMIQNRILLEAKRLLQASESSIKEIAYELGFNDLAYFSNFFKTQTGFSPRQFKERL